MNYKLKAGKRGKAERERVSVTGWVRIHSTDVIRTPENPILMEAKHTANAWWSAGRSDFLSEFSIPQANATQPAPEPVYYYRCRSTVPVL